MKEQEKNVKEEQEEYRFENFSKFFSELFFQTHSAMQMGPLRTIQNYLRFLQSLQRIQQRKDQLTARLQQGGGGPQSVMLNVELNRLKSQFEGMLAHKLEVDTHLLDPSLNAIGFYSFTAAWLLRLAEVDRLIKSSSSSSVFDVFATAKPPPRFSSVPELLIENMADYLLFVCRVDSKRLLLNATVTPIVELFVLMLGNNNYIRNPYLRSKLAEVLYLMSCADDENQNTNMIGRGLWCFFENHKTAKTFLVPSLLALYVAIETTGRDGQFYEKFFVRRNIAILLKHLRTLPHYAAALKEEPARNLQFFLKFVHRLLDDSNYLLDEVFSKLKEAMELEQELRTPGMPRQAQVETTSRLTETLNSVHAYSRLATEVFQLLHFSTGFFDCWFLIIFLNLISYFSLLF